VRRVLVLGSTGSIGTSALDVARTLGDRFRVVGLAARTSAEAVVGQAADHGVGTVALDDESAAESARAVAHRRGLRLTVLGGPGASMELLRRVEADVIVQATVGAAALPSTIAALETGKTLALANKEALVMAGPLLMETAARCGATLVPVDSEHSAIFQCLRAGRAEEVERILLTTSGGAFRDRPIGELAGATPEEALRHPTWKMGPRITVDSATMMNKALEVAEAVALFHVPPERIRVVLHPQSIVHSMVEFRDGSVMAQMSRPDMRLPILFAMAYPDRPKYEAVRFSIADFATLTFRDPDPERYPALELGYRAARAGGVAGAVLNAADEAAVDEFLGGRLAFPEIAARVRRTLDTICGPPDGARASRATLDDVLAADRRAREEALRC
jgi:1-deoxy-D-xylulose-5-phosphate reductoisomerase